MSETLVMSSESVSFYQQCWRTKKLWGRRLHYGQHRNTFGGLTGWW